MSQSSGYPIVTTTITNWQEEQKSHLLRAIESMCASILRGAQGTVPYKDGDLRGSGRVERIEKGSQVAFGGGGILYAHYQERGMRADGTHVVKRYTTPGTGAHYLENAGNAVVERGIGAYL